MKKNYLIKESVSNEWIDEVTQLSQGEVYCIQGGLNDAYLIDFRGLRYGRVRRKWLVVVPEFANTWGDDLHAMFTDDDEIAEKFISEYEKQQDSVNIEGEEEYDSECGDYRYYPVLEGVFMKTLKQIRTDELNKLISKLG